MDADPVWAPGPPAGRRRALGEERRGMLVQQVPEYARMLATTAQEGHISSAPIPRANPLTGMAPLTASVPDPVAAAGARLASASVLGWLKRWSWRLTAACLWFVIANYLFGFGDSAATFARTGLSRLLTYLTHLGLGPTDPKQFATAAKAGWVLLITGCRAMEIIGFFLYILLFPLLMILRFVFRKRLSQSTSPMPPGGPIRQLRASLKRLRVRSLAGLALFLWYFLYGATASRATLLIGMLPAALLLLFLVYRAFGRARPRQPIAFLSGFTTGGWVTNAAKMDPPPAGAGWLALALYHPLWRLYRRMALCVRRWRAPDRTWLIVLAEFIGWPLTLLASGVAFWALAYKFSAAPAPLPWRTALLYALSLFLPAVSPPPGVPRPAAWVAAGGNLTAFILFGLYVALTATFAAKRQQMLSEALSRLYPSLRWNALRLGLFVRWLEECDRRSQPAAAVGK
jgi:hypothetical protein